MTNFKYILLPVILIFLFIDHNVSIAQEHFTRFAWSPNTEPHLSHYIIYRDTEPVTFEMLDQINKSDSTYQDNSVEAGMIYYYKLTAVDSFGIESAPSTEIKVAVIKESIPKEDITGVTNNYQLKQNYPNPFNPETNISFSLATSSNVVLAVYDLMGKEVIRLVDGFREAGDYHTNWNGRDNFGRRVASGVYFYYLITEEFSSAKMMLVQK